MMQSHMRAHARNEVGVVDSTNNGFLQVMSEQYSVSSDPHSLWVLFAVNVPRLQN